MTTAVKCIDAFPTVGRCHQRCYVQYLPRQIPQAWKRLAATVQHTSVAATQEAQLLQGYAHWQNKLAAPNIHFKEGQDSKQDQEKQK